jgi:hypothetical protein
MPHSKAKKELLARLAKIFPIFPKTNSTIPIL